MRIPRKAKKRLKAELRLRFTAAAVMANSLFGDEMAPIPDIEAKIRAALLRARPSSPKDGQR